MELCDVHLKETHLFKFNIEVRPRYESICHLFWRTWNYWVVWTLYLVSHEDVALRLISRWVAICRVQIWGGMTSIFFLGNGNGFQIGLNMRWFIFYRIRVGMEQGISGRIWLISIYAFSWRAWWCSARPWDMIIFNFKWNAENRKIFYRSTFRGITKFFKRKIFLRNINLRFFCIASKLASDRGDRIAFLAASWNYDTFQTVNLYYPPQ